MRKYPDHLFIKKLKLAILGVLTTSMDLETAARAKQKNSRVQNWTGRTLISEGNRKKIAARVVNQVSSAIPEIRVANLTKWTKGSLAIFSFANQSNGGSHVVRSSLKISSHKFILMAITLMIASALFLSLPAFAQKKSKKNKATVLRSNPQFWPPVLNRYYPDLELINQDGKRTRLSSFRGRVIIVEPIGMNCPACQAFAGANKPGVKPYGGFRPQPGLKSIDEMLSQYAGVRVGDPRIVLVQLLLYSPSMKAPTYREGQAWARNFGLYTQRNAYVLVGTKKMINRYSYNMIPGFQLIDKNFVLRSDSTGHHPKNNLYTHLLPMVKKVL